MEFGILLTSHPNPAAESYPHRAVHERATDEVQQAERMGYDTAWIAEHHFSTRYGIMPDCFACVAHLAARPSRLNLAAGQIDIARYAYVSETDAEAHADTEEGIIRHIAPFGGAGTGGYLGTASEKGQRR